MCKKLYGLSAVRTQISLDSAVEEQNLMEERPFHRALDDAYYGKLLTIFGTKPLDRMLSCRSGRWTITGFHPTKRRNPRMTFPGYSKYVSRIFDSKEDAMADKGRY